jgi:hypothetical protein
VNRIAALAMKRGKSVDFTGDWQRHVTGRREMVPGARRINVSCVDSGTQGESNSHHRRTASAFIGD